MAVMPHRRTPYWAAGAVRAMGVWWGTIRPAWHQLTGGHGPLCLAVLLGAMAGFSTMSMVNLALPDMSRHFALPLVQFQWVASVHLLGMALATPATAWLVQRWGLARCLGAASALLLLGGLLSGTATGFDRLLLGRGLQGVAAGVLQPLPLVLVQGCVAASWRGRALGMMGTGLALTVALGPLAGGVLVARFGWSAIFVLPLPLLVLAMFCLGMAARRDRSSPARWAGAGAPRTDAPVHRLDWQGLALASVTVTAATLALSHLASGRVAPAGASLLVGLLAGGGFALRQIRLNRQSVHAANLTKTRTAPAPLVPRALAGNACYRSSCLAALAYGWVLNGFTYLLPLWLHVHLGLPVDQAGTVLLVGGLAMVLVQAAAARQVDLRPHRPMLSLGFALLGAALVGLPWLGQLGRGLGGAWVLGFAAAAAWLCRTGLACAFAALFVPAQRSLPQILQAPGATLAQLCQTMGGVLGLGTTAAIMQLASATAALDGWSATAMVPIFCGLALPAWLAAWHCLRSHRLQRQQDGSGWAGGPGAGPCT